MNEKLLPCPFCGGEACENEHKFVGYTSTFGVVCLDCCAETRQFYNTSEDAIAAWNRRAQQENKPLTLEELYQAESEPLYFFCTVGRWLLNGWHIVEPLSYANYGFKDLRLDNKDGHVIDTFNYGKTWVAYRSKPKEEV